MKAFQKLFRSQKSALSPVSTHPLPEEPVMVDGTQAVVEKPDQIFPQLSSGCAQSVGIQRDHNEDALFTLTAHLSSDKRRLPFGLYIVADGMGGHQQGEVASGLAVRVVAGSVVHRIYGPLLQPVQDASDESIQELLRQAVQEAHRTIIKEALGSGTTITAVLVLGDQLTIAHVGDSRAYQVSADGSLQSLTRDHSLVRRLEELGQITAEEAAVHPQRNVLYRALGQGEPLEPDLNTFPLPQTGHLLLCSDGLWGVVPEESLTRIISEEKDLEQACEAMIAMANAAGGPDNITAILVKLPNKQVL